MHSASRFKINQRRKASEAPPTTHCCGIRFWIELISFCFMSLHLFWALWNAIIQVVYLRKLKTTTFFYLSNFQTSERKSNEYFGFWNLGKLQLEGLDCCRTVEFLYPTKPSSESTVLAPDATWQHKTYCFAESEKVRRSAAFGAMPNWNSKYAMPESK